VAFSRDFLLYYIVTISFKVTAIELRNLIETLNFLYIFYASSTIFDQNISIIFR